MQISLNNERTPRRSDRRFRPTCVARRLASADLLESLLVGFAVVVDLGLRGRVELDVANLAHGVAPSAEGRAPPGDRSSGTAPSSCRVSQPGSQSVCAPGPEPNPLLSGSPLGRSDGLNGRFIPARTEEDRINTKGWTREEGEGRRVRGGGGGQEALPASAVSSVSRRLACPSLHAARPPPLGTRETIHHGWDLGERSKFDRHKCSAIKTLFVFSCLPLSGPEIPQRPPQLKPPTRHDEHRHPSPLATGGFPPGARQQATGLQMDRCEHVTHSMGKDQNAPPNQPQLEAFLSQASDGRETEKEREGLCVLLHRRKHILHLSDPVAEAVLEPFVCAAECGCCCVQRVKDLEEHINTAKVEEQTQDRLPAAEKGPKASVYSEDTDIQDRLDTKSFRKG
ncbi:hypothetical protein EYF80_036998 [Liparis tanakae]|uniref:Uncharacterized protein n=1 Tax=Liparis tanakae TaxID=230148 RepID=A0A4Z2GHW7_9TELE|nr:hypothetical protein EYF80_036998 [Liparis tanakae]